LEVTSRRVAAARLITGTTGLLILLGCAHAVTHAFGGLMPLIFPSVMSEFHLSYGDIGLLVGFTTFAGGMLQLIYGWLDRYVLRKFILAAGQFVIALSCIVTGLAPGFPVFFLGNLGARIGASPQHPLGNSLLAERFPVSERGSALSLHVVGGNMGTVLVPVVGAVLLSLVGWRTTLLLLAIVPFRLTVALAALLAEKREPHAARHASAAPTRQSVREILGNRTIVLIMLASVIGAAGRGLNALNTYLPLYMSRNLGLPTATVNILYTCLLVGGVIGPFAMGKLSDRIGRRPVLYLAYSGAATLLFLFLLLGNAAALLLGVALLTQGIFSHSDSVLLTAFLADVASPVQRDVAFSLFFTVAFGVGALWPTVLGRVADSYGLVATFGAMGLTYLIAALCLVPIHSSHKAMS
jgi:FSR family fosmidomycin resistance protein-like MFS transporter